MSVAATAGQRRVDLGCRWMKEQLFGVRLAAVAQHERPGRARFAAEQTLRRKLEPVVHAGHRPRLVTAVGEGRELAATTAELPGPT